MSVIQSTQKEVRYLKRKNLEEESRMIGNWYRDCIRMYGIDCVYWKLNTSEFQDFKKVIDQNAILKRAYGYDIDPQYDVSANMITFAEVDNDVFTLNKYGILPQADINLVFDSTQFACDLAPRLGRYVEYKIDEREITCEVPEIAEGITSVVDPQTGKETSGYVSAETWPYALGLGDDGYYTCGVLSGRMRCVLSGYAPGEEQTAMCEPYEHTTFDIEFPANSDLYRSLSYTIANDDYLETMIWLTYRVDKVDVGPGRSKFILKGRLHGSVLFFDLDRLDKYTARIHPDVGDIVEIDFPDDKNREKYEITECYDKQLTQDGVNPLLHKYVWKCKARRYVNSFEDGAPPSNEADDRLVERRDYDDVVQEQVAEKVSKYDPLDAEGLVPEDAAYGGYSGVVEKYDKEALPNGAAPYENIQGGELIDVFTFGCGSRLLTDGFDLVFAPADGGMVTVAKSGFDLAGNGCVYESGTRWLKATDRHVAFVNVVGEAFDLFSQGPEPGINIDPAYEQSGGGDPVNQAGDNFLKFGGCRSLLYATRGELFVAIPGRSPQRIA